MGDLFGPRASFSPARAERDVVYVTQHSFTNVQMSNDWARISSARAYRVGQASDVFSVAGFLSHSIRGDSSRVPPELRVVGPEALERAITSVAIAATFLHADGVDLWVRSTIRRLEFGSRFPDGQRRDGRDVEILAYQSRFNVVYCEFTMNNERDDESSLRLSCDASTSHRRLAGAILGGVRTRRVVHVRTSGSSALENAFRAIEFASVTASNEAPGVSLWLRPTLLGRGDDSNGFLPEIEWLTLIPVRLGDDVGQSEEEEDCEEDEDEKDAETLLVDAITAFLDDASA